MKKHAYTIFAMTILLGSLAVTARAQCSNLTSKANIPFPFNVSQTRLPAGEYTVQCLDPEAGVLLIRSIDRKASAAVIMTSIIGKAQDQGKLLFHRYGSQYFFVQAWTLGTQTGLELPMTRAESRTAREWAGIKPTIETTALTARR
jgi:hypothetical protein